MAAQPSSFTTAPTARVAQVAGATNMFADGAPARFALLLHGKIGRLNRTASEVVKENVVASRELITLCSRSHLHFIVAANSGSGGGVDVTDHHSNPTDRQQIGRLTRVLLARALPGVRSHLEP